MIGKILKSMTCLYSSYFCHYSANIILKCYVYFNIIILFSHFLFLIFLCLVSSDTWNIQAMVSDFQFNIFRT